MEMNVEKKIKVMRISTYVNKIGSLVTNDARCTREIKFRIAKVKAAVNKKKTFHQQIGLKFKDATHKVLHLESNFLWCWKLDTWEKGSEIPGKFWNVVLEKNGDHVRN